MDDIAGRKIQTAFVTQWFPPEPTPIPLYIAQALQRRGHQVEVFTGVPNYPTGVVADGYKTWLPKKEKLGELSVRRSPLYASHDSSALKRMANYLSWALSTTLFGFSRIRRSDVTLVFSSPATAALPAMFAQRVAGTPYVLYIQDLWPDSVTAAGFVKNQRVARLTRKLLTRFTNYSYRHASHIAVLSPGMLGELETRGVPRSKLSLIYNWAEQAGSDEMPSREEARSLFGVSEDAFVVSYAGNHGAAQGLDVVIRAASRLTKEHDIQFLFFGDGMARKSLEALALELNCTNVTFIGAIPQDQMPYARSASDIQLVSLVDDPLFEITMPSKIQGILASGKPLIAVAAGDAARVVDIAGAGWSAPPGDDPALAERILEARDLAPQQLASKGINGLQYYQANMSEEIGGLRLDKVLRQVGTKKHTRQRVRKP